MKDYNAPEGWKPQVLSDDSQSLYFGKHKGKKLCDVPADYLLFMEENGWLTMSDTLREACEMDNLSEREKDKTMTYQGPPNVRRPYAKGEDPQSDDLDDDWEVPF